jgi:hypothetical protein
MNRADYSTIVHERKLVLELPQRGFPTNRPSRWLALYGYLQFSWEEKLVMPLTATPNMEKCANRKTKGQSIGAWLQAMHVTVMQKR